jgi:hypothetical protein
VISDHDKWEVTEVWICVYDFFPVSFFYFDGPTGRGQPSLSRGR